MNATDVVGWTNGTGCSFCTGCEPSECEEKAAIFAGNEGWNEWACDGCGEPLDPDHAGAPDGGDYDDHNFGEASW